MTVELAQPAKAATVTAAKGANSVDDRSATIFMTRGMMPHNDQAVKGCPDNSAGRCRPKGFSLALAHVSDVGMDPVAQLAVNTIRTLSIDAVQKANSGHPGLPLGAAPMAY